MTRIDGETQFLLIRPAAEFVFGQFPYASFLANPLVGQESIIITHDTNCRQIPSRSSHFQPHGSGPRVSHLHGPVNLTDITGATVSIPKGCEVQRAAIGRHNGCIICSAAVEGIHWCDVHTHRIQHTFRSKLTLFHDLQSPFVSVVTLGKPFGHHFSKRLGFGKMIGILQDLNTKLQSVFWWQSLFDGKSIVTRSERAVHRHVHQRYRLLYSTRNGLQAQSPLKGKIAVVRSFLKQHFH